MVSRGARDLQLHLKPEWWGGLHLRLWLLSRSQHHGKSSHRSSRHTSNQIWWVLWRVSWQPIAVPHIRICGRQDKNQFLFFVSLARFSPVSSLVYVLSAFDKVYRSHSFQSYDVSPESSSRLELGAASMSASGLYTCLVTGGDIPFLEDSDSKTVMVASKSWY